MNAVVPVSGRMPERLGALADRVILLPESDRAFAQSLLQQWVRKGSLSDKQWLWVDKLVAATVPKPKVEVAIGNVGGVIGLFKQAMKNLKFPKLTFALPDGKPLQLSIAGPNSKAPGTVVLTDGRPYGGNTYYGRVTTNGVWEPVQSLGSTETRAISKLLTCLSADPAGTAAAHGKATGRCVFCNSELSNEGSLQVGYGPICARRYSLPWKAHA